MSRVIDILGRAIDLMALVQKNSEMFDFSKLNTSEKIFLLEEEPKVFAPLVLPTITKPDEKTMVIINVSNRTIREAIKLTDEDLAKVDNNLYFYLVQKEFKKYIRLDQFARLPAERKSSLILSRPKWVFENVTPPPKLTSDVLYGLSVSNPEIIDTYVKDFSNHATTAGFWRNMIKFNARYRMVFLQNTKSLITKTDVRNVIKSHPLLIKELDEEIITNSKLTVKEWVLLCNTVADHKDLVGWEFSDEMKEIFKLDSLADLLSGKAKLSKRFSNAIARVLNDIVEADEGGTEI